MITPNKQTNDRSIQIKSIPYSLKRFTSYCYYTGISILLGSLFKIFFHLDENTVGKDSWLTGIPFIRTNYFLFPITINVLLLIELGILFSNPEVSSSFNKNFWRFAKKTRLGFIFTNLTLLGVFYIIYIFLYIPIWDLHKFKLSGHILACLFSGCCLTNIENLCNHFVQFNIKKDVMNIALWVTKFLICHNIYSIFWTVWVFHEIREAVISFGLAIVYILIINCLNLDKIMIFLIDSELPVRKQANKMYGDLRIN